MAIISGIWMRWQRYTFILTQRDKILAKDISEDRHWLYLGESLANRVTGWAFRYRENPLCIGWDPSLLQKFSAATPSAAAASVTCQNTSFQRTRELTLFPGLIPAQAIKFLPSQQPLQLRLAQSSLLFPALKCRRAFLPAREEVPESILESATQQQRVKPCSRARLCNHCVESS